MGLIDRILGAAFGSGRNVVAETVEVFRPNAEAEAGRQSNDKAAALAQFAAEFSRAERGPFDRLIDGLNRLPRPALALGTVALFVAAMVDPVWFADRMAGVALVPEPLWWLMGAVVSFYFGARHQAKGQEFRRSLAATAAAAPAVTDALTARAAASSGDQGTADEAVADRAERAPAANPAVADWQAGR